MRIISQSSISSSGNDQHIVITIDWFDREWKILINDNHILKRSVVHLWDDEWRPFDNRSREESIIHEYIKQDKIVKLKYRIQ